jgi:hypothetical protein
VTRLLSFETGARGPAPEQVNVENFSRTVFAGGGIESTADNYE